MSAALADPVQEAVRLHLQEATLTSRERWARWEEMHGLGLHTRGAGRAHPSLEAIDKAGLNEWPKPSAHSQVHVLKGATDTQALHTRSGVYTAERKQLHDKIVAHFMAGKKAPKGKPEALFMAGGAASGKSHALKANPKFKPKDAVEINPDEIKEHLPEYQEMMKRGDRAAAAAVHEESSDIAKRLMHEARKGGHNILVDGTGDSKRHKFEQKLVDAHKAGYKVRAMYVTVPTHLAVERSVARAHRTGRHVPIPEVEQQHRNVSAWFHDVANRPEVHELHVYDTSSGGAHHIATAAKGKLSVHDHAKFGEFLAKGKD